MSSIGQQTSALSINPLAMNARQRLNCRQTVGGVS